VQVPTTLVAATDSAIAEDRCEFAGRQESGGGVFILRGWCCGHGCASTLRKEFRGGPGGSDQVGVYCGCYKFVCVLGKDFREILGVSARALEYVYYAFVQIKAALVSKD